MMPCASRLFLSAVLVAVCGNALAQDVLMVRSNQAFPEAMSTFQESIRDHGYTVTRVQRIDIGLTGMGYKTDKYRVVFFGKIDEFREIIGRHPELIPYLPLKVSIFAEGDQTLLVAPNPVVFRRFVAAGSSNEILFDRWSSDIKSIFQDVMRAE